MAGMITAVHTIHTKRLSQTFNARDMCCTVYETLNRLHIDGGGCSVCCATLQLFDSACEKSSSEIKDIYANGHFFFITLWF